MTKEMPQAKDRHTRGVHAVVVAPDGATALSCSWDGTAALWDVVSGKRLRVLRAMPVASSISGTSTPQRSPTPSPLPSVVAAAAEPLARTAIALRCGAFSPTSEIAFVGGEDALIRIVSASDGSSIGELNGHHAPVVHLHCFTALLTSGTATLVLVSCAANGDTIVWDVRHGGVLCRFNPLGAATMAAGTVVGLDFFTPLCGGSAPLLHYAIGGARRASAAVVSLFGVTLGTWRMAPPFDSAAVSGSVVAFQHGRTMAVALVLATAERPELAGELPVVSFVPFATVPLLVAPTQLVAMRAFPAAGSHDPTAMFALLFFSGSFERCVCVVSDGRLSADDCGSDLAIAWERPLMEESHQQQHQSVSRMTGVAMSPARVRPPFTCVTLPSSATKRSSGARSTAVATCAAFGPDASTLFCGRFDGALWFESLPSPALRVAHAVAAERGARVAILVEEAADVRALCGPLLVALHVALVEAEESDEREGLHDVELLALDELVATFISSAPVAVA